MLIGHFPAGFIFSSLLVSKLADRGFDLRYVVLAGVIGAVAPDLDMFYFYLIDNRQHHHHTYWPHFPIVWLSLLMVFSLWFLFAAKKTIALLGLAFSANGLVHMLLDSIVGNIWWFAPILDKPFAMFTVPALYNPWWLNFVFHWSFVLELIVLSWAIFLWYRKHVAHRLD